MVLVRYSKERGSVTEFPANTVAMLVYFPIYDTIFMVNIAEEKEYSKWYGVTHFIFHSNSVFGLKICLIGHVISLGFNFVLGLGKTVMKEYRNKDNRQCP